MKTEHLFRITKTFLSVWCYFFSALFIAHMLIVPYNEWRYDALGLGSIAFFLCFVNILRYSDNSYNTYLILQEDDYLESCRDIAEQIGEVDNKIPNVEFSVRLIPFLRSLLKERGWKDHPSGVRNHLSWPFGGISPKECRALHSAIQGADIDLRNCIKILSNNQLRRDQPRRNR